MHTIGKAHSNRGYTVAAIWKGSLTFGLVHIPVELRTGVRADHISFRLLHKEDLRKPKAKKKTA